MGLEPLDQVGGVPAVLAHGAVGPELGEGQAGDLLEGRFPPPSPPSTPPPASSSPQLFPLPLQLLVRVQNSERP